MRAPLLLASLSALTLLAAMAGCSSSDDDDSKKVGTGATGNGAGGAIFGGSGSGGNGLGATSSGGGPGIGGVPQEGDEDEECGTTLAVTYRDFKSSHPDFQAFGGGGDTVGCEMVKPLLGADGKPEFNLASGSGRRELMADAFAGCTPWDEFYTGPAEITSAETFFDWYHTDDTGMANVELTGLIELTEQPAGSGAYVYDSSAFFPLDGQGFGNESAHNFHFTTEIHLEFGYVAGQKFTFRGDDDLWVFVNGKLAMDLGGLHRPLQGTIDFDTQAADLGISPGRTYNMDVFHAERHTDQSNFRIETNIKCFENVPPPIIQ